MVVAVAAAVAAVAVLLEVAATVIAEKVITAKSVKSVRPNELCCAAGCIASRSYILFSEFELIVVSAPVF